MKGKRSNNKTAQAILDYIDQTGGLNGSGEKICQLGREFREDFEFKHDQVEEDFTSDQLTNIDCGLVDSKRELLASFEAMQEEAEKKGLTQKILDDIIK